MLLYLARHGQTPENGRNIVQGHLDPPLSPIGEDQAEQLGRYLRMVPFTHIWSSDQLRAAQTAAAVAAHHPKLHVVHDHRLKSRFMGSLQGVEWSEGKEYPPDVEPQHGIEERLRAWLDDLLVSHTPSGSPVGTPTSTTGKKDPSSGIVLAVTHDECLRAMLSVLTGRQQPKDDGQPPSSPIDVGIPGDVDTSLAFGNTSLAIVRVWWEQSIDGPNLIPRGRMEAWAVDDHLD